MPYAQRAIHRIAVCSLLAACVVLAPLSMVNAATEDTWESVGPRGFTQGGGEAGGFKLTFSPLDKQPYVSYTTPTSLVVQTYNGSSWVNVGGSVGPAGSGSVGIAIHPVTNAPYVLYTRPSDYNLSLERFTGTSWELVGAPYFSGTAYNPHITVDTLGTPYVSYYRYGPDDVRYVNVMKYDGTSWVQVGDSIEAGGSPSVVAINSATNEPYLAYYDTSANAHLSVARYNGTSWVTVGSDIGSGGRMDFGFNPVTHEPYIAYTTGGATVKRFDGASWVLVGNANFGPGMEYIEMAFNPSTGHPYVAGHRWTNEYKPEVLGFNGASWIPFSTVGFYTGWPYAFNLDVNPETGNPNIAYLERTLSSRGSVMKYIPVDTIAPTTEAVVAGALVPGSTDTYIGTTTVTLSATDNPDGMGLAHTYVSVDGGAFEEVAPASLPYTTAIATLGTHTVQYYSTDVKGNQETTKSVTFTITQETQPTNGSISGVVFKDDNRNGVRDVGERAALWVLYIDANGNNRLDWGEKVAATNCNGEYHFNDLVAGTYTVREIDRPLWIQTAPASGEYEITLSAGQTVTGKDFGNDLRW